MPFDNTPLRQPHTRRLAYGRLTAQAIFDRAVSGLLRQGWPAKNAVGSCVLLAENGDRCAVGQVLDRADLRIGWGSIAQVLEHMPAGHRKRSLAALNREHYALLLDLQDAHDNASNPQVAVHGFLTHFCTRAYGIARTYGLNTTVLES